MLVVCIMQLLSLQKQLESTRKVNLKGQESSRASEVKVERLQATIRTMQTQVRYGSIFFVFSCNSTYSVT